MEGKSVLTKNLYENWYIKMSIGQKLSCGHVPLDKISKMFLLGVIYNQKAGNPMQLKLPNYAALCK